MLKTSKQGGKPHGFPQWTLVSKRCRESKGGGTRLRKRISGTKVSGVVRGTLGASLPERE